MIEAMKGSEFGYCDHCCEELEAFESHERVDSGFESPSRSRSIMALSQRWMRSWAALKRWGSVRAYVQAEEVARTSLKALVKGQS